MPENAEKLNLADHTAFQLKSSSFTFTVLHLYNADLQAFKNQLNSMTNITTNFFQNAPIIIDLQQVRHLNESIDFAGLKAALTQNGLIPVGFYGGNDLQEIAATGTGMVRISKHKTPLSEENQPHAKLITQPVRSGQRVYAAKQDLIILSTVNPGAEVIADGNIHIYGSLRGRALAGVSGDKNARIFCCKLEAQIISIAGIYRLSDNIEIPEDANMLQIYIEKDHLKLAKL